jgi:hypothetical protein
VTDGGTFGGYAIEAVGPIKSGAVWYRALTTYLTEVSDFEDAYAQRQRIPVGETAISTVSVEILIKMKETAGRPRDLEDVRHLKMIRALRDKEGSGGR